MNLVFLNGSSAVKISASLLFAYFNIMNNVKCQANKR